MHPVRYSRRAAAAATLAATFAPNKPRAAALGKLERHASPRKLPEAGFTDADGATVTLADFHGRGVVLNLWATWCPPCVAEMPSLDRLARTLGQKDIVVLPLSSDRGGASVVRAFYDRLKLTELRIWLDPRGTAARTLGARGLPTTLLIGKDGLERARLEGEADWSSPVMVAQVRELLDG